MAKRRQSGRCVLLGGLALLGCGEVTRGDAPASAAGVGGAAGAASAAGNDSSGGAVVVAGGTNVGGAAERDHAVCENAFVVGPGPGEEVELGFVGTYDGQATELVDTIEKRGVPAFGVFRIGQHLESVNVRFSMTAPVGDVDAGIHVVDCVLWGVMLRRVGDSITPFKLEAGWIRSTTFTADWETGTTQGSLHFVLVNDSGSERHVLDGSFTWPTFMPDLRQQ